MLENAAAKVYCRLLNLVDFDFNGKTFSDSIIKGFGLNFLILNIPHIHIYSKCFCIFCVWCVPRCSSFDQACLFPEVRVTADVSLWPSLAQSPQTDLVDRLNGSITFFTLQTETRKSWGYFRELTTLTCAWSSSMPAAIIASPASRYEGSTWRQIPLEVSLVRRVSLIFSIFIKEPLGQSSTPGPLRSLCSCEPKCCQLEDPDAVCLCQPALCHDHLSALCLDDQTWFLFISS